MFLLFSPWNPGQLGIQISVLKSAHQEHPHDKDNAYVLAVLQNKTKSDKTQGFKVELKVFLKETDTVRGDRRVRWDRGDRGTGVTGKTEEIKVSGDTGF